MSYSEVYMDPAYQDCTHCNGYGSSLEEDDPICSRCGGTGVVRKESQDSSTTEIKPAETTPKAGDSGRE